MLLVLIDRFNSEPFEEDMVFPTLSSRLLHEASFWLVVTFSLKPVGGVGISHNKIPLQRGGWLWFFIPFAKPYIHKPDDNDDCKSQPHFVDLKTNRHATPGLGVEINLLVSKRGMNIIGS